MGAKADDFSNSERRIGMSFFSLLLEGSVIFFVMAAQAVLFGVIRGIERVIARLRRLHGWASVRLDARMLQAAAGGAK
jgi:hypothetical protein